MRYVLTEAQQAFLDELHYAVIGTLNPDGTIQQTVVWYLREDNKLRFGIGGNSIKARNLRQNPTITVSIVDKTRYLSVSGTAVLEPSDIDLRRRLAARYLGPERVEEWVSRRPDAPRLSVRVTILRAYGQRV
ncbi:MAG: PPOX class F420-dependent oxidoreductase [Chloroflexaceae bacterium]|nr:PPOX class F420-dependent oxidoreductase [Chloroflexaceae bacterium]